MDFKGYLIGGIVLVGLNIFQNFQNNKIKKEAIKLKRELALKSDLILDLRDSISIEQNNYREKIKLIDSLETKRHEKINYDSISNDSLYVRIIERAKRYR